VTTSGTRNSQSRCHIGPPHVQVDPGVEDTRVEFCGARGPHLPDIDVILQVEIEMLREIDLILNLFKVLGPLSGGHLSLFWGSGPNTEIPRAHPNQARGRFPPVFYGNARFSCRRKSSSLDHKFSVRSKRQCVFRDVINELNCAALVVREERNGKIFCPSILKNLAYGRWVNKHIWRQRGHAVIGDRAKACSISSRGEYCSRCGTRH
jgi:hypothetical protein